MYVCGSSHLSGVGDVGQVAQHIHSVLHMGCDCGSDSLG